MSRRPRRNDTPALKAKLTLAIAKRDQTVMQLATPTEYTFSPPVMIMSF